MKRLALLLMLLAVPAYGQYPIVTVKVPWTATAPGIWTNADNPTVHKYSNIATGPAWNELQLGNKLTLIAEDGTEETLLEGSVIDPNLDPAAEWVFYAKAEQPFNGFDIYKMNLTTRQEVRLTHHEWTPSRALNYGATWNEAGKLQGHPPSNICPVVMGNRVLFCSNRDCLRQNGNPRAGKDQCFLIYAMDTDGKNVERVVGWHLGSVLHPEKHPSGKMFASTNEKMGYRSGLTWALWAYYPDGTEFEPWVSGYNNTNSFHGHTALPGAKVASVHYYTPRNGTGTIIEANPYPTGSPAAPPRFGFPPGPNGEINEATMGKAVSSTLGMALWKQHFITAEARSLTPFTHNQDMPSPVLDGVQQGYVSFPSPAPNGLLMTLNGLEPTANPYQQWMGRGRLTRLANYTPVTRSNQLVTIKDDPNYSYIQAKAVVPEATLYGQAFPVHPWIANDGTKCPAILPKGTPFALIGSASTIGREWMQWAYASTGGQIPATVADNDPRYIRIYVTRPSPVGIDTAFPFQALARERLDILCDVPIRHIRSDGTEPIDGDGNPDTSWLAKIPGDTPITLACLNANKEQIALARTWHGLRCGEVRWDCGGCHKHTKGATNSETTEAHRYLQGNPTAPFIVGDGTRARMLQLERDVQPILTALGLTASVERGVNGAEPPTKNVYPGRALRSPLYLNLSGATAEQKQTVCFWIDSGAGQGDGMLFDDMKPTLNVSSPLREQATAITVIRFGAWDVHTSIASKSVKASFAVQGRAAGQELADLFLESDSVWTLAIPSQASGEVTVKVTDAAGNSESLTRTFPGAVQPVPNPELEQLRAELAAVRVLIAQAELNLADLRNREADLLRRIAELEN